MELNEPHTKHEHASLNLKVLLLAFAVVLIAALGYMVWQQNHSSTDTMDEAQLHPKTTVVSTADWKTYTNATYGWSVKYPPTWTAKQNGDSTTAAAQADEVITFSNAAGTQMLTVGTDPVATAGNVSVAEYAKDSVTVADYTVTGSTAKIGSYDGYKEVITLGSEAKGTDYFVKGATYFYRILTTTDSTATDVAALLATFKY